MSQNFIAVDRDQVLLMPPLLREWLPADHYAWFVLASVEQMDLTGFVAAYRPDGHGRPAHDPGLMVALLIYAYSRGLCSSRGIERACVEDIAFRVIASNLKPDHATIARFHRRHEAALAGLFTEVFELCAEAGLAKVGMIAIDGSKLSANASQESTRSYEQIVRELLERADRVDAEEDELQVVVDESWRGRRWVAESDIANCFEAIPHEGLMSAIEERIVDRHLLKLLRAMLRAGVLEDGSVKRSGSGTPHGGVISPVLANVYLHRLDRQWARRGTGVLIRYADDLLVMCKTKQEAETALTALSTVLAELGLELKQAKTRIVHLREGGEGFDFLGFHHRYVRGNTPRSRHLTFLVRWPSRQAMQRARHRVREITARERLRLPVEEIVGDLNRFLGGWAGYFRYGNSAQAFDKITLHAINRLSIFVANRHQRERRFGWWAVARQSPDHLGLIDLNGIIVPPRAFRPRHRAR